MYLSRLAAHKEYSFMVVLHREGFPVPRPIAWSRHTVVMEFIDSFPLRGIESIPNPGKLYAELMDMIVQLARRGLIHGDFNEFNILIKEKTTGDKVELLPILIDFPQTVSTNHSNAQWYFDRDVECIRRYFERKFKYTSDEPGPFFKDALKGADPKKRLDIEVEASGFSRKMGKDLERFIESTGGIKSEADPETLNDEGESDEDEDEEDGEADEVVEEHDDDASRSESGEAQQESEQPQQVEKAEEAEKASVDDTRLAEEVQALTVEDETEGKQLMPEKFGFQPIEPREADIAAEKVRSKKKASGWAI
jgi:RIO kinase 2